MLVLLLVAAARVEVHSVVDCLARRLRGMERWEEEGRTVVVVVVAAAVVEGSFVVAGRRVVLGYGSLACDAHFE